MLIRLAFFRCWTLANVRRQVRGIEIPLLYIGGEKSIWLVWREDFLNFFYGHPRHKSCKVRKGPKWLGKDRIASVGKSALLRRGQEGRGMGTKFQEATIQARLSVFDYSPGDV